MMKKFSMTRCWIAMVMVFMFVPVCNAEDSWGLISENAPAADKIPLILVHGDNSYKEKDDRWDYFLDWATDNSEFNKKYEIWRFHHDTRELIGYDGKSGNAKELGDAIVAKFGFNRRIMLLGHSRGGLVSRSYMCNYGNGLEGDRVIGLITLGTPHHGSPGAVPDWGLQTVKGKSNEKDLAKIFYGHDDGYTVNVSDIGTMGLAWDNFDGPENGVPFAEFYLESDIGNNHVLSIVDTNMKNPELELEQSDSTAYIPDRSNGTLEELNSDTRYFGKIIAYGGYKTEIGLGTQEPLTWLNLSFSDHTGLEAATLIMADMISKTSNESETDHLFMANDGMVPLQSALFLKKDSANEPIYDIEEDDEWYKPEAYDIKLKNLTPRMNFRKAVLCPDYDHLDTIEGKGGITDERAEYWEHVAVSLNTLADLDYQETVEFTPSVETFKSSSPTFESVSSGSNCFVQSVQSHRTTFWFIFGAIIGLGFLFIRTKKDV